MSLVQLMDQSVLENLKRRYRKELLKKLLLADESSGDSSEVSCFDFWKRLTIKDAMYMVSDAWNCGVPGGRDQVDAIGSMTDEQLLHMAGT